jgi:hypothetical protein
MQRSPRELWLAFIAILLISAVYLAAVVLLNGIPPASELFGHLIGILGFIMMLMTETLYTLRKRSHSARWGRTSSWLSFHIFTGIVGPYMVLLHSSWKFHGLAGLVTLLTVIVVASGFIGRYIYTAIPRTADEVEVETSQLERRVGSIDAELLAWKNTNPQAAAVLGDDLQVSSQTAGAAALLFARPLLDWRQRYRMHRLERGVDAPLRRQVRQLEKLVRRRNLLRRQMASLALARRTLAIWHAVHVPLGMVLFAAAFIHIIAAVYYAELL